MNRLSIEKEHSVWQGTLEERSVLVSLAPGSSIMPLTSLASKIGQSIVAKVDPVEFPLVLVSTDPSSSSLIPLSKERIEAFEKIARGCSWTEACRLLGTTALERLLVNGIFIATSGGEPMLGPTAPLILLSQREPLLEHELYTDSLSQKCLSHVGRFLSQDRNSLYRKLYEFNHAAPFLCRSTSHIVTAIGQLLTTYHDERFCPVQSGFGSSSWYLFELKKPVTFGTRAFDYKIYLSPIVEDTLECIERMVEVLPKTNAAAWKVGKSITGLLRPDKICLYFTSSGDADNAAQVLLRALSGLRAQGVPFTHRHDANGLISEGVDPAASNFGNDESSRFSWRMWVCRKLALALSLSSAQSVYGISPAQSALWSLKFLGVDPRTWRLIDDDFWRN